MIDANRLQLKKQFLLKMSWHFMELYYSIFGQLYSLNRVSDFSDL